MSDFAAAFARAITDGDAEAVMRLMDQAKADAVRPVRPGELIGAALWYANRGVPVFPAKGKIPLTKNGLNDASTNPEQIRQWWKSWPAANVAAVTGVKFNVIDIDGQTGTDSLLAMPPFDTLGRVLTPRYGGYHLYLPPSERGNVAGIKPGIDYRGKGGYVVVPPSIGSNFKRYAWVEPPAFLEA